MCTSTAVTAQQMHVMTAIADLSHVTDFSPVWLLMQNRQLQALDCREEQMCDKDVSSLPGFQMPASTQPGEPLIPAENMQALDKVRTIIVIAVPFARKPQPTAARAHGKQLTGIERK